MIDREDLGSWLEGPRTSLPEGSWPGKRIGLPESGPGSRAPLGRRFGALIVDWVACSLIAVLFVPYDSMWFNVAVLVAFFLENVLLVSLLGTTLGHRLFGLSVRRLGGGAPGFAHGTVRTLLLMLVLPAVVYDADHRGFHDIAGRTVIVRNR
ncbi:RDD family protein [Brevibacterium samyangense]|uniref:RDD family protein n=1 Tax=Brevibacterium samyangense TaxID=366888 RepID=A0ABP5EZG0_9MICO